MITSRRLQSADATEVAALIAKTLRIANAKDYSQAYLDQVIQEQNAAYVIQKAKVTHFYVFCDQDKIVGIGSIGSYWGS